MYVSLWNAILLVFSFRLASSGYIENVEVNGCESCKLYLTCRHLKSVIAIFQADFLPEAGTWNETLSNNATQTVRPHSPHQIHPRQALNRRCSGVNHCSFILAEDCPGAHQWGPGTLSVKYACITDDRIRKYCNTEIILPNTKGSGISEGFIHNPGYPRFYSTEKQCHWRIRAPNEQKIRVTILDLAVAGSNAIFPEDCTDYLEVFDEQTQVAQRTCRPQEPPMAVLSSGGTLDVVLASAHSLLPLRGFLVHFAAVGCATPPAPDDGYLVYRNDTVAEYRCCVGFAFPDGKGGRTRSLRCLGAFWDVEVPLPNCEKIKQIEAAQENKTSEKEMASDLVAPVLLIVALFLINSVVLFYIYRIRQKNVIEVTDEELGTLKAPRNALP